MTKLNGEELKAIRLNLGLTQREMAVIMKVQNHLLISQWENGYRHPTSLANHIYTLLRDLPPEKSEILITEFLSPNEETA